MKKKLLTLLLIMGTNLPYAIGDESTQNTPPQKKGMIHSAKRKTAQAYRWSKRQAQKINPFAKRRQNSTKHQGAHSTANDAPQGNYNAMINDQSNNNTSPTNTNSGWTRHNPSTAGNRQSFMGGHRTASNNTPTDASPTSSPRLNLSVGPNHRRSDSFETSNFPTGRKLTRSNTMDIGAMKRSMEPQTHARRPHEAHNITMTGHHNKQNGAPAPVEPQPAIGQQPSAPTPPPPAPPLPSNNNRRRTVHITDASQLHEHFAKENAHQKHLDAIKAGVTLRHVEDSSNRRSSVHDPMADSMSKQFDAMQKHIREKMDGRRKDMGYNDDDENNSDWE